jgi:hypothetical protein
MKNFPQLRTTLIGLVALLIPILAVVGWVSPERAGLLGEQAPILIEAAFALAASVAAFWAIFKTNDDG